MAAVDISLDPTPGVGRSDLVTLAHSRAPDDRRRLMLGIADLCETAGADVAGAGQVINDVFLTLVHQVEKDIRQALSERLAEAAWAPVSLINILALDEIEIARPIIAKSPLLKDQDLIRVLLEATVEHQIEVARRPGVGAVVVDAILDRNDPAVLTALASNVTADISEPGVKRLVEASRRIAGLRAPLARHPRLTQDLAQQLYTWVGQALRQAIGERFRIDSDALDAAIDQAVRAAHGRTDDAPAPAPSQPDPERDEMERRLIAKLDSAGQLSSGYLVRAAREGRVSLFENALAVLGGYSVQDIRRATSAQDAELLALACASVGIDRAAFPSMLAEVRGLTRLPGGPNADGRALRVFELDMESAARTFRRTLAASDIAA